MEPPSRAEGSESFTTASYNIQSGHNCGVESALRAMGVNFGILLETKLTKLDVGTLPDGYHKTNPLPQVPTKQSVLTSKVRLPPYFRLPIGIPTLHKIIGPTIARARIPW
jgi:hypothetical protein